MASYSIMQAKRFFSLAGVAAIGWLAASTSGLGQLVREPNTTLQMPNALPVFGYVTTNAFGSLTFANPVVIASPPGETNRLFIVEQRGVVSVITNLASPNRTVFMDLDSQVTGGVPNDERGLLGMAFHPGYATNRFFYLYYSTTTNTAAGSGLHQRLSRFQTSLTDANQGLTSSETPILTLRDEASNHNGGDLHFGSDGYLYLALGDEGGGNDSWNNSQQITKDFWSGIIRIDVDKSPGNFAPNAHPAIHPGTYLVPTNNPWVGATSFNGVAVNPADVRTEFYAVGLRNPWRMSFDPDTGRLYCGDVGQGAREEIDVIRQGGNYGWAYREGFISGPRTAPAGLTFDNPILDYPRGSGTEQGSSVTGGVVYRGNRIPDLFGHYVFADYVSGNIWSTYYDGTNATSKQRLTGNARISGFGIDPANGDILLADQGADAIQRLVYVPVSGAALPPTLADTGAFANLDTLEPHAGIVAYDINVPFWSDNANKSRWFSLPNLSAKMVFRDNQPWNAPVGALWIKHFELELTNGIASSRRRLETRFLVRGSPTYGVTYRWDDNQTNATLVPDEGLDETFVIEEGGIQRTQVWRYPSRTECLVCHTPEVNYTLGFNTWQLNRDFDFDGLVTNQIQAYEQAGYFFPFINLPPIHSLRALARLDDESHSVEQRVRSWLTANCFQCHQSGSFDARIFTPLSQTSLIHGEAKNNLGNTNNVLVRPGSLAESMLLARILTNGPLRMPPLASSVLDTQAIALVSRWITNDLLNYQSAEDWQLDYFGSTNTPEALLTADADLDRANNFQEYLTGTSPINGLDFWSIAMERNGDQAEVIFPLVANRGFEVQWTTNLFNPLAWEFLNVRENRPLFSASNRTSRVPDQIKDEPTKYYRVRVYEP